MHFRVRTVINDQILSEQCVAGGITYETANSILVLGASWDATVDFTSISNWLVTVLTQGVPPEGIDSAVKVKNGMNNFKVIICYDGPDCTLQG